MLVCDLPSWRRLVRVACFNVSNQTNLAATDAMFNLHSNLVPRPYDRKGLVLKSWITWGWRGRGNYLVHEREMSWTQSSLADREFKKNCQDSESIPNPDLTSDPSMPLLTTWLPQHRWKTNYLLTIYSFICKYSVLLHQVLTGRGSQEQKVQRK